MYLAQIDEARKLASPVGWGVSALDTAPAFVVQYVPNLGTGGTAATIALVQATSMTFLVDAAAPAGDDAIGTAGVIDISAAANDTIGELVDTINGTIAWRAYIVGALRADTVAGVLAKTATTCLVDNGLTFYWDSSAVLHHTMAVSGEKFQNYGISGHVKDADDHCENYLNSMRLGFEFASNGAGTVTVHSASQLSDGTSLFTEALTDATTTGINEFGLTLGTLNPLLRSTVGQRLVVRCADDAADDIEGVTTCTVNGKTAVLKNQRMVTEVNY